MAIVAPYVRKHLSADALFRLVHSGFASLQVHRPKDAEISFTDALMSAFAMFSLKAPSLLAFDKERAEGNLHTIYGIARVPCDTHMRQILDPVSPKVFRPVFTSVFRQLQRGKALEPMVLLDGHYNWRLMGRHIFPPRPFNVPQSAEIQPEWCDQYCLNVARKRHSIPCEPHPIRPPRPHGPARACRSSSL